MNSVVVIIIGFLVFFIGYRFYSKHVDTKIIKSDPKRATPAKMFMDGVEFMPTSKNILFGYQFKSIAGAAPVIGPILAIQWGWLPALLWILLGTLFIGWVHDYSSAVVAMRNEGASFGGLSYKLISPRARIVLLSFIYFFLLLVAGAFGAIVVNAATGQKSAPMAWLLLTIGGILAGQMIYRWKKDIILTTIVCVVIALLGIYLGTVAPSNAILGNAIASNKYVWGILALVFCYFAAVLPIWRFALPINYVASYIVFLGLLFGIIGVFVLHPDFTLPAYTGFSIKIGPLWPILFVTIACGAISGWHSIVSSSGTARQLEYETDARPVGGGVMFVEMMLASLRSGHCRDDFRFAFRIFSSHSERANSGIRSGSVEVFGGIGDAGGRRELLRRRDVNHPCSHHPSTGNPVYASGNIGDLRRCQPHL